ncbi:hypothetical protein LTR37_007456 [Vermiconidia calcicola]|uniref:Uncharacterized protein n=1 Tax=Vermiconidia calcicola TaxID=1690605 RepID=A0ACC3NF70_9PEZI|nr:hypothetical protein LTR37_007456 [Vermiconidia calcicola]
MDSPLLCGILATEKLASRSVVVQQDPYCGMQELALAFLHFTFADETLKMIWSNCLALLVLHVARASSTPHRQVARDEDAMFTVERVKAFAPPTDLEKSNQVLNLRRTGASSDSSKDLMSPRAARLDAPLNPVENGAAYAIDVGLGNDTYSLIFDTGSSDLWVAETGVQCMNARGRRGPVGRCEFGPLFSGDFQDGEVEGQTFEILYGDGEFLVGTLGYEDVTVAGITIDHQKIASVSEGYWLGDGVTSGIIGFAYASLTSAYKGTKNVHYENFIDNAIDEGKTRPMFSVAIERSAGGGGGQVAFGGLPNVDFERNFTSTPLEVISFSRRPIARRKYTYYTITPDALVLEGEAKQTSFPVILDTGTTLAYLPPNIVEAINLAFDPPSLLVNGFWENDCNATAPEFAIDIAGTEFRISEQELLLNDELGYDWATGLCACGIQASPTQPYILGDTFLKNVVAVFDIGASEMRFAPHVDY